MLSLANAFRTATRRQTCTVAAAATRSMSYNWSQSPRTAPGNDPQIVVHGLAEMMSNTAAEQAAMAASPGRQDDQIIDSVPESVTTSKNGFPILKGFKAFRFVQPKDFSRAEYLKPRSFTKRKTLGPDARTSRRLDTFHQLGIDIRKECLNTKLLSRFVTSMGKIRGRNDTNLTWQNQRRMGKAIRRAKMMGIIPVLSKRPLHDPNDILS